MGQTDMKLSNKIIIIGCTGSGKSTFATKLQKTLGLPLVHLDNVWWKPDRTHISREEFDKKLEEILSGDRWIMDGFYNRTLERRIEACEIVIFLDYDEQTCMQGIAERVGQKREDIPWVENSLDPELVELIKNFFAKGREECHGLLEKHNEKTAYVFKTRAQADEWLNRLTK